MRHGGATPAILASLVLATSPAHAADLTGAKTFVAWIYSHYAPTLRGFDVLGSDMPKVFHSSLIELIKEDQKVGDDESPDVDGDPLCDCRNPGGLAFTIESVTATEFGRAGATIIRRGAVGERDGDVIVLDLAQTNDGWRVYDVRTGDTPSLRAFLIKAIRDWKGQ